MSTINGNSTNEVLFGTGAADLINGFSGDDQLFGDAGNDTLNGGIGNDALYGDEGSDILNGDDGGDILTGSTGNDTLEGGVGNDTAVMFGNQQDYQLEFNANRSLTVTDLNSSDGDDGIDVLMGVESIQFADSNWQMTDMGGNDVVLGYDGNDVLRGYEGDDVLTGGMGNDTLDGGVGNDSAVFAGNQADFRMDLDASGQLTLIDLNVLDGNEGTDVLTGIETIQFADRSLQVTQLGEFRVQAGTQYESAITALLDDGFVVTWSFFAGGVSSSDVHGQRYSNLGNVVGTEFLVNTTTANSQDRPAITTLLDGGFVVTWRSYTQGLFQIYGQRYNNLGNVVGTEFRVSTTTAYSQDVPAITALSDGGFVVTWSSQGQDGSSNGVYGQRYSNLGDVVGTNFRVNTTTANSQYEPAIIVLSDGGFVVTWSSDAQDGSNYGVYGQRYSHLGNVVGTEFRVNTTTANNQSQPAIIALSDGGFVVTWTSHAQDGSDYGVYGQRYSNLGNVVGTEFRVNTTTIDNQETPAITALLDGGFVVTWTSHAQDLSSYGVYGQRFNVNGKAISFAMTGSSQSDVMELSSNEAAILLAGGLGDDTYKIGLQETVIELANEGTDTVETSVTYSLVAHVENLILTGTDAVDGTGNDLDNNITGNSNNNLLDGAAGNDTINAGSGDDNIRGGYGNDSLIGGTGNDTLIGGAGNDQLMGGVGLDTYTFASSFGQDIIDDILDETVAGRDLNTVSMMTFSANMLSFNRVGNDYVMASKTTSDQLTIKHFFDSEIFVDYSLRLSSGTLTHAQMTALVAPPTNSAPTGSATAILANGTEDVAYTVSAASLLQGFSDSDGNSLSVTNLISNHGTVTDNGNGTFTIASTANYNGAVELSYQVSDGQGGVIAGSQSLNLVVVNDAPIGINDSNDSDAIIESSPFVTGDAIASGNVLSNDTDVDLDVLSVGAVAGNALNVGASVTGVYGSVVINADGTYTYTLNNSDVDTQALSTGQSVIDSFSYSVVDTQGLSASATLAITITGNTDRFVISSDISYTLATNENDLILTGTNDIHGTGNSLDNVITGNSGNNLLDGSEGNDTLDGGLGTDTMSGGAGNDTYIVDNVGDVVVETALSGLAGSIVRVSTDSSGAQGNSISGSFSVFSPDGKQVAFYSQSSNLVVGDTNASIDVFVKNLITGAITRVSTDSSGAQANAGSSAPAFSPDGTKVAFLGAGSNLVEGDSNGAFDIFVKNLITGAVTRVSTDSSDAQANGASFAPVFSPDGTQMAIESDASNLVVGDTNGVTDIFVKNLSTGAVTRVSTDSSGAQANGASLTPVFSPDGTKVVFKSDASNLVAGDTNNTSDIFVKNLSTGAVTRVSTDSSGAQGNGASFTPVFSPDGTQVAFSSSASSLVSGDTNGISDIFVKNLITGAVTRVSTDSSGAQGNDGIGSASPIFSADGTQVAFQSDTSNLVVGDTNGTNDIFVKNLSTGAVTRVSTDSSGAQANGASLTPVFSPDGTQVAFLSFDSNLVDDTNGRPDIFIKNILSAPIDAGGIDTVQSSISYTLGQNLENLTLTGSANLDGTGNSLDNVITGNSGNNILNGGAGADTISGGAGNDSLSGGLGDDVLDGGLGDDTLAGGLGTDSLKLGLGNDTVIYRYNQDGGDYVFEDLTNQEINDGADDGVDTYKIFNTPVNSLGQTIRFGIEANTETYPNLVMTIGDNNLTLGTQTTNDWPDSVPLGWQGIYIENFFTRNPEGSDDGTPVLTAVSAHDVFVFYADEGVTEISRMTGQEIYNTYFSPVLPVNHAPTLTSASAILANGQENALYTLSATQLLQGFSDVDGDLLNIVNVSTNHGTVTDNGNGTLSIAPTTNYNGSVSLSYQVSDSKGGLVDATQSFNLIKAVNVNTVGTTGGDMLHGGSGDDTFIVNHVRDVVFEEANGGIDTVQSTLSHILRDNVENLILVGDANLSGTGSNANNSLTGNNGNNRLLAGDGNDTLNGGAGGDTLNGGSGTDVMFGGTGNDTFTVENLDDTVTEFEGEGFDTVNSFISYTLTAHVERLSLEGVENLNGFGNDLDNTLNGNNANNWLVGGLGNDTLQGKGGADTLEGGMGNDLYYIDNAGDIVTELANDGVDKVSSSMSYTLTANVEQLFLTGIAGLTGTGNELNNVLYGNSGNNHLDGGLGDDSLSGGLGNDVLVGGSGNDTLVGGAGNDVLIDSSIDDSTISSLGAYYLTQANNMLVNNLGGANGFGEQVLSPADDALEFVDLSSIFGGTGLKWGNTNYTGLYVDNNGSLNLDGIWDFYENIPVKDLHSDIISAFWADVDTRGGALTPTIGGNSLGTNSVYYDVDTVNGVFTATWDDVGAYKLHTDTANAFQIQLVKRGSEADFDIVFRYEATNWTTADNFEGLPPIVASAGYSDSQGKFTYQLTASSDVNNMLALDERVGNTGKTGVYVFNVRNGVISSSNDSFDGGDGADTLVGGVGNDTLSGGAGNDIYLFGLSFGKDLINNADISNGGDKVLFDTGITDEQLWLRQVGNDLEVSIIGTANSVKVQSWYSDVAKRVDSFALADGKTLLATEVQTLVEAMAAFAPPPLGQTSLNTEQQNALNAVIAASW